MFIMFMWNTVNHRLTALSAYLQNKRLGWALIRTGLLIVRRRLIKISEIKVKETTKWPSTKDFRLFSRIFFC